MEMAIGLTFPGKLQDEAVICYLCKNFDIEVNIIEASFSITAGWAILKIKGNEGQIKRAIDYLTGKEIKTEKIETKI